MIADPNTEALRMAMIYRMSDAVVSMATEELRLEKPYYFVNHPAEEMLTDAKIRKRSILAEMTVADAIEVNAVMA